MGEGLLKYNYSMDGMWPGWPGPLPAGLNRSQHLSPQDRIDPGLVAFALGLKPIQHVGIDARRNLALAWAIEVAAPGMLPLFVGHLGDVAGVDLAVGTSSEGIQSGTIRLCQLG